MPEEDLTYNISLNEEELGAQLERIRSQIDLTMGSLASGGGGAGIPQASDLIDFGAFGGASGGGGVTNVSAQMEQGMWSNMSAGFDQAAETATLGFNKFSNDMRRIGLLSSPQYPDHSPQNIGSFPQHPPTGLGQSMGSMMAPSLFGFNPNRGGMNYYDYRSQAADNVIDSFSDFTSGNAGAIAGTAIGSLGGWSSAFAGFGIGSTIDLGAEIFGRRIKQRMQMADGLKAIADDAFNGMGSSEARSMASVIQDQVYSLEGQQQGYEMDAVQQNVINFANAGGFSNSTNPQEMEETLRGVVENTREFANNLKMAQEDAVRIMAELESNMVMNTSEMGSFSANIRGMSDQYGLDPGQTVGFGMQGMEMLRGTGAHASQGFNMAVEARLQAERLSFADPTTRQLINQAGGADQFAYGQMETAATWMQSGQGMMAMTGLLGGMNGMPGSITGMLQGSANYLTQDPNNFFEFQTRQGELNASLGFQNQQAMMVSTGYRLAEQLGRTNADGTINEDALAGIMKFGMNMDPQQAKSAIRGFQDYASMGSTGQQARNIISQLQSSSEESMVGPWQRFTGTIGYGLSQLHSTTAGLAYQEFSDYVEDSMENAGDFWIGRERWRGTGLSRKRLEEASEVEDSSFYREMMREGVTESDIERTVEERSLRRRHEIRENNVYSMTMDSYRSDLKERGIGDDIINTVLASSDSADEALEKISQLNQGSAQGNEIRELIEINRAGTITGDLTDEQLNRISSIDLSEVTSQEGPREQMDSIVRQMTGGEVETFADASKEVQKLANYYGRSNEIGIRGDKSISEVMEAEDITRGMAMAQAFKTKGESLTSQGRDIVEGSILGTVEGLVKENMNTDMDSEAMQEATEYILTNPDADPEDFKVESLGFKNREQFNIFKGYVNRAEGSESASELLVEGRAFRDRGRIRKHTEEILGGMGGSLLGLMGNQSMKEAMDQTLLEFDMRGQDFKYGDAGNKQAYIDKLIDDGMDEEVAKFKAIDRENEAFDSSLNKMAENITREQAMAAAESGNANLFIKNATKAMETQLMSSLNNIIDEDGINVKMSRTGWGDILGGG